MPLEFGGAFDRMLDGETGYFDEWPAEEPNDETDETKTEKIMENKTDLLNITVGDGKYTLVQTEDGHLHALRYMQPWRDLTGDGFVLALGQEIDRLNRRLRYIRGCLPDDLVIKIQQQAPEDLQA